MMQTKVVGLAELQRQYGALGNEAAITQSKISDWAKVLLVIVPTLLIAAAQVVVFINEPVVANVPQYKTYAQFCILFGVFCSFVFGVLSIYFDKKDKEINMIANNALAGWHVDSATLEDVNSRISQHDASARESLANMNLAIDFCKIMSLGRTNGHQLEVLISNTLAANKGSFLRSLGFTDDMQWAIQIYSPKKKNGDVEKLECFSQLRSTECDIKDTRRFERGVGAPGLAWSTRERVIVADLESEHAEPMKLPPDLRKPNDIIMIKSLACYPILMGEQRDVWGVVCATCSSARHFELNGSGHVRSMTIALVAGLLAVATINPKIKNKQ